MVDYTTPRTVGPGDRARAADWNAGVRDNMEFFSDPPKVAVRLTSDQTVPDSGTHTIEWDDSQWDTFPDGALPPFDVSTPGVVAIRRSGLWQINLHAAWRGTDPGDDTARTLIVDTSDWGTDRRVDVRAARGSSSTSMVFSDLTNLSDGATVTVQAEHGYGDDLDLISGRTYMTLLWVARPPAGGGV